MKRVNVTKLFDFEGHKEGLYALCASPREGHFFSAGADGLLAEWNYRTGQAVRGWLQTQVPIYSLAYLPRRNWIAVGQYDGGIRWVDLGAEQLLRSVQVHQRAVFAFAFDETETRLYAVSGDGSLSVWNIEDQTCLLQAKIADESVRTLLLQDQQLVLGASDNEIRVYDAGTLEKLSQFEAHSASVFTLAYLPETQMLVSGGRDAHLKAWEAPRNFIPAANVVAHHFAINHIIKPEHLPYFATASKDKTIKIWDALAFRLLKVIDKPRHGGHSASVNRLLWPANGNVLLSASDDRTVKAFEITFSED